MTSTLSTIIKELFLSFLSLCHKFVLLSSKKNLNIKKKRTGQRDIKQKTITLKNGQYSFFNKTIRNTIFFYENINCEFMKHFL